MPKFEEVYEIYFKDVYRYILSMCKNESPAEENNAYQQNNGDGIEITSRYVGPKDDGILIWEQGMDLPAASDFLEQMFNTPHS